jgi:hypothetical protein
MRVYIGVAAAAYYEAPFKYLTETVLPVRQKNRRAMRAKNWWILGDPQKAMRAALLCLPRFLITPRVSKHRLFVWSTPERLTTDAAVAFASDSDYVFGVLQARFHEVWALKLGTRLETRPRYTPSTCVEAFPFPRPTPPQETGIAAAAKELNELRERWLNPPEWTETRKLEFPGSVNGPWARYVDPKTVDAKTGVGTVRYPCLEPRDADCAAKLKRRTLTNLYNERPAWLELAHKKLDMAVACAYGWNDFAQILEHTDEACIYNFEDGTLIQLDTDAEGHAEAMEKFRMDFDEKILERLLALNLERAEEEAKAAKVKKPKTSREKRADELV